MSEVVSFFSDTKLGGRNIHDDKSYGRLYQAIIVLESHRKRNLHRLIGHLVFVLTECLRVRRLPQDQWRYRRGKNREFADLNQRASGFKYYGEGLTLRFFMTTVRCHEVY